MKSSWSRTFKVLSGMLAVFCLTVGVQTGPAEGDDVGPAANPATAVAGQADEGGRVSVSVARERAKLMHDIYAATLEVLHDRYFHADRAVLPARAMEDIFAELKRQSRGEAKWMAVNLKAMNINNEPKSEFELRAAKEIGAGKGEFEILEDGYYRRAAAIPLAGGCVSCHGGFAREQTRSPKFAALVISLAIVEETENAEGR